MPLPDIFSKPVAEEVINRLNKLQSTTKPQWGIMNAEQLMAHLNVTYEMVYTDKHPAPFFPLTLILKLLVKKKVVTEVPYGKNTPTAPAFKTLGEYDFEAERTRLINYINQVQQEGRKAFEGKKSLSFGNLTAEEWNNMFYKHLNHHLTQFGV